MVLMSLEIGDFGGDRMLRERAVGGGLGEETLCKEVADSFTWRRFCRIAIDGRVPDPTTLMKLTKRLGPELLEELNAELLALAVERKVLRSRRLRVDTTVVEADIRSPTDSGLCAHAVSRLTRLGGGGRGGGGAGMWAWRGTARSPTGASRWSIPTRARSGWAAHDGRPSSATRRASPTAPRGSGSPTCPTAAPPPTP